jgi:hypothetical protein
MVTIDAIGRAEPSSAAPGADHELLSDGGRQDALGFADLVDVVMAG